MPIVPDFGFCGPTYLAVSPVLDAERSLNLYPEPNSPRGKGKIGLIGRPGLSTPWFTLPTSPMRLLWGGNISLYAASGSRVYRLSPGGGIMTNYGPMFGSSGTGPMSAFANGVQLLWCDPSCAQIFNANNVGPSMDSVFNGVALEYLDGFYVAIAANASLAGVNPNQINVSALGDGTTWPPLAFAIRTGSSDLTTQLAVLNGMLWIFGQKTIEIWYNAGNPIFPFARVTGSTINLGLLAPWSVAKFQNTIMWLGADSLGYAQVYMSQGLNPVRVSNFGIENIIATYGLGSLPFAWAHAYQEAGHTFYVLNLCETSTYQPTKAVVYDLSSGLWHERSYMGQWPVTSANSPLFAAGGPNFIGDGYSGGIHYQGINYPSDNGSAIAYLRNSPHVCDQNRWHSHSRFELAADIGTAQASLTYSNNGGKSFVSWSYLMKQAADQGAPDTFNRYYASQLGRSRDRVYSMAIGSSTELVRISDAYLWVDGYQP